MHNCIQEKKVHFNARLHAMANFKDRSLYFKAKKDLN